MADAEHARARRNERILEGPAASGRVGAGFTVARPSRTFVALLIGAWLVSALAGLLIGRGSSADGALAPVFLTMRAHRVAVAFLSGAALSVCGAIVQGLFRNPLANPAILGTTSGALLGAHLALLGSVLGLGGGGVLGIAPEMLMPIGAVLGACLSLFTLLAVVSLRVSPLVLILTGWALMMLFQSISTLLNHLFQEAWELNRAVAALNVGSLSGAGLKQVLLALVMTLGGSIPAFFAASSLDVLLAGEEEAASLGVDVQRTRFWLVLWVAIMTAGAVAVGGSVGFVGLIVPHAVRPWVGLRHRYLLPAVFVAGGTFVVACDVICRLIPVRADIPLGVVTDLIGAPIFLRMLIQLSRAEHARG
jgi:iron complex transport system permease protein